METKTCTKCNIEKKVTEYHKNKTGKYGVNSVCKICRVKHQREYVKNNPEKVKESINRYINSDKGKKTRKKGRRKYYLENKELENTRSNAWNKENIDKVREYNLTYSVKRRIKDKHKIMWRSMLHASLRRMGTKKEGKTIDLLGYNSIQLKEHLEKQFTDGMTWDNYGEWHIDHIKPVSKFSDDTPPNIVNALTNLRPLWATTRVINGVIYEGNLNRGKDY